MQYTVKTSMKFSPFLILLSLLPIYGWTAEPGDPAPECSLPHLNEEQKFVSLSQLKGKVVFLDFWASWCPPCEKSFPFLDKLHQQFNSKGLEVIAVNVDEDKQDAMTFLEDHPVNFTIVYDGEGICPERYQIMAMPSSYIIDKTGKIHVVNLGFQLSEEDALRSQVTALLNE